MRIICRVEPSNLSEPEAGERHGAGAWSGCSRTSWTSRFLTPVWKACVASGEPHTWPREGHRLSCRRVRKLPCLLGSCFPRRGRDLLTWLHGGRGRSAGVPGSRPVRKNQDRSIWLKANCGAFSRPPSRGSVCSMSAIVGPAIDGPL